MNVSQLFAIQQKLDERILAEHGLERSDLLARKIIALHVELAELANETRCFKYWSTKAPSPRPVILEEYVDALHFTLSLGLDLGCTEVAAPLAPQSDASADQVDRSWRDCLTEHFTRLLSVVTALSVSRSAADYRELFEELLQLGRLLGFSEAEIERAYLQKNEENHRRQNEGY